MSHPEFPLYDRLVNDSQKITSIDWELTRSTINNMDSKHGALIYSLILHHYFVKNGYTQHVVDRLAKNSKSSFQQPYQFKLMGSGKGAMFSVDKLPLDLQQILSAYVTLALNQ